MTIFDSLIIATTLHLGQTRFTRKTWDMAKRSTGLRFAIRSRAKVPGRWG